MASENLDRYDIALGTWVARESALATARKIGRTCALEPGFIADLEEADRQNDTEAWNAAVVAFFAALDEALE